VEVKVGIVGCGVVGTGTVALLLENAKVIEEKTGIKLSISKVADKGLGQTTGVRGALHPKDH
jgi:homoserine dehydrogenase